MSSGKVRELMIWLRENAGDNLTAVQMAQYILLQAVTLNGSFGRLLDWRWRGETRAKANRALRLQGLLVWHGLVAQWSLASTGCIAEAASKREWVLQRGMHPVSRSQRCAGSGTGQSFCG